jgi:membrane protein required for colicin V production
MIIDIIFLVLVATAVWKGYQRGLIVAVFSIIALIAGLAAALKLSAVVAQQLDASTNISSKWLPLIAFLIVFFAVLLLIRWGAALIEKGVELAFLGWINKIGGIALYLVLYIIMFSIFLFYCKQFSVFSAEAIAASRVYSFVEPWGPTVIDGIGAVIPVFKNLFKELQEFFGKMQGSISA